MLLMSLTFAVAAVRLSQRGMLVQYMNAVESVANVDTVCLDKTGTLTDGTLTLHAVVDLDGDGAESARALVGAYAAAAGSRNATLDAIHAGDRGRAVHGRGGGAVLVALEVERASPRATAGWCWARRTRCWRRAPADGRRARARRPPGARLRPRAASRSTRTPSSRSPPPLEPVALVVLEEQLRSDAADTIAFLRRQGVAVKVMSGDSPSTVAAVAERVGIEVGDRAWDGAQLPDDPAELRRRGRCEGTVFARLTPEHKRPLVDALTGQRRLRCHDRRRRQRRARDEAGAAGGGARQRQPAGQERGRQRAGGPTASAPSRTRSARADASSATSSGWPSCSSPSRCSRPS